MGLFLENLSTEFLLLILLVIWSFYWHITKNYDYWEKRKVPNKKPEFPFGSIKEIFLAKTFYGKGHDNIYKEFPNERFYGIIEFRTPVLVVKDPELIKKIMVKDFQHFADRTGILKNPKESISRHLLDLEGQEWKDMRAKLTPTFTSGKIKLMYQLMEKCCEQLKNEIESEIDRDTTIDVKNLLSRFTLDIIASCAFGIETNTVSDERNEFFLVFGTVLKTNVFRFIRRIILLLFPGLLKVFRINLLKREHAEFITNVLKNTIEYRQKNNIKRNDFIDLLMSINRAKISSEDKGHMNVEKTSKTAEGLTIEQMAAQTFLFVLAGFHTSSSALQFCLYELARHQDIQDKLHRDIADAVEYNGGTLSYQVLSEIPYLDQVIYETLRLYGTTQLIDRACTTPYKVPESDLVIEKNTKILIPLFSLHHDPQYFPNPYTFDPDRFKEEEVKKRHPYVFLPFGDGPRNCIGKRFGQTQVRVGLATVLLNFRVRLSPKQEVPIEIDKKAILTMTANPVLLEFTKRT